MAERFTVSYDHGNAEPPEWAKRAVVDAVVEEVNDASIDTDPVGRPGQPQGDQQWPEGSACG